MTDIDHTIQDILPYVGHRDIVILCHQDGTCEPRLPEEQSYFETMHLQNLKVDNIQQYLKDEIERIAKEAVIYYANDHTDIDVWEPTP